MEITRVWEYRVVSASTIKKASLEQTLNLLGLEGWEVVGFAQSDKTIGLNSLEVIMKRPRPGGTPTDPTPGWHLDPLTESGSKERYWSGASWTSEVRDNEEWAGETVDPSPTWGI